MSSWPPKPACAPPRFLASATPSTTKQPKTSSWGRRRQLSSHRSSGPGWTPLGGAEPQPPQPIGRDQAELPLASAGIDVNDCAVAAVARPPEPVCVETCGCKVVCGTMHSAPFGFAPELRAPPGNGSHTTARDPLPQQLRQRTPTSHYWHTTVTHSQDVPTRRGGTCRWPEPVACIW